jgi:hypothetical protein
MGLCDIVSDGPGGQRGSRAPYRLKGPLTGHTVRQHVLQAPVVTAHWSLRIIRVYQPYRFRLIK